MGMGMQCWNGNGWECEWKWFDGNGKGMRTRKSFPHTCTVMYCLWAHVHRRRDTHDPQITPSGQRICQSSLDNFRGHTRRHDFMQWLARHAQNNTTRICHLLLSEFWLSASSHPTYMAVHRWRSCVSGGWSLEAASWTVCRPSNLRLIDGTFRRWPSPVNFLDSMLVKEDDSKMENKNKQNREELTMGSKRTRTWTSVQCLQDWQTHGRSQNFRVGLKHNKITQADVAMEHSNHWHYAETWRLLKRLVSTEFLDSNSALWSGIVPMAEVLKQQMTI